MRYRRSRRHLRKTAEEPEKETYTDFELELDIPGDANHQQLVAKMPATNMSDNEEQVMSVSPEPWSRAPSCRQTRRPAYLNDYVSGGARSRNLGGGAFEGQHPFWGGKIEFHEISPPPRCQNF